MSRANARVPSEQEMEHVTTRAVAEIIPHGEFLDALRSGRSLRLKMGFDPSAPDLTLGHAVGLRKLRQLQDLGHRVVLIVGDWTAQIGDPSGQSKTRPMLTAEQVRVNAETYLRQFFQIVDRELTEVRWQSEWFDGFRLADIVRLAAKFTVAQMLQREDFAQRFAAEKPVGVHELFYPLLQAYDSVAVQADVEFGGLDQKFNLLVGRELQAHFGQKPQSVFLVPLLVGTDGKVKMSKSLGNYVAIDEPPAEMFGKLMSIPDHLMLDYYELLTDVPDEDLASIRKSIEQRAANPMDHKMRLAREIVSQFHGPAEAEGAEAEFVRTFRRRELPEDVATKSLSFRDVLANQPHYDEDGQRYTRFPWLLVFLGLASSQSEAQRLIRQRAVEIDGAVADSAKVALRDGMVIRVGKHRFLRIVDADLSTDS